MDGGQVRRRSLLTKAAALLVLGFFALMIGGPTARSAADNSRDVRVINDATQPVPVAAQGTTAIAGSVGIDPAANGVVVANSSGQPIPVAPQSAPIEPVQILRAVPIDVGAGVADLFTVPDGKRLVIEHVTVESETPLRRVWIRILDGSSTRVLVPIPLVTQEQLSIGSEQITLYAGAGQRVVAHFIAEDSSVLNVTFAIIGQLFDVSS